MKNGKFFAETERVVYLVRHAKPHFPGGIRLCIGRTDPPLSVEGIRQSAMLARRFDGVSLTGVYSSPLRRALETAIVMTENRWPVVAVEGMQELSFGVWEGRLFSEVMETEAVLWDQRLKEPHLYWPEGGESPAVGLARAKKALYSLLNRTEGDIALVAHSEINRALLADLMGMPLSRMLENEQQYVGVTVLRFLGEDVDITFEDATDRQMPWGGKDDY